MEYTDEYTTEVWEHGTEGSGEPPVRNMDKCCRIGKKIRELREKAHMTQESLAEMASLNKSYISLIENGKANLTIHTLDTIARALGTSMSYLMGLEDEHTCSLEYIISILYRLPPDRLKVVGRVIEIIAF